MSVLLDKVHVGCYSLIYKVQLKPTERTYKVNDTRKRLDFQVRAGIVFEAIFNSPTPLPMGGIAEVCGMTRSPYLREIIDTLWSRGFIEKGLGTGERGHAVIIYWAVKAPDW